MPLHILKELNACPVSFTGIKGISMNLVQSLDAISRVVWIVNSLGQEIRVKDIYFGCFSR